MWNISNESVKYTGDTLINGQVVKKLKHLRFFMSENQSLPTPLTLIKQSGDTIFVKNSRTGNQWQILYNFAAQPGQGWANTFNDGKTPLINTYTKVDSVKQVLVDGLSLKRLYVTYDDNIVAWAGSKLQHQITERFGSNVFLFPFYCRKSWSDDDWIKDFLCYQDSSSGLHQFSSYTCNYSLAYGLENLEADVAPNFFPNPVGDFLNIEHVLFAPAEFTLYDVHGRVVKRYELDLTNLVDLRDLHPGIYLARVRKNGRTVYRSKIIRD